MALSSGQTSLDSKSILGDGLSIQGGFGHLAIRDDYISQEVYSGILPYFETVWIHSGDSSGYRLALEFRSAGGIQNYNVSAAITQGSLGLDYRYFTGTFPLAGHDVFSYVGPSADVYLYYREQNIANGGMAMLNAYSFAMFFSLGVNSALVLPLTSDFSLEGSGKLNLLSFGARLADLNDHHTKFVKATSALSGLRGRAEVLLRYDLNDKVLLKAGYRFEIFQSSSWDYLIAASDNVLLVVSYRL